MARCSDAITKSQLFLQWAHCYKQPLRGKGLMRIVLPCQERLQPSGTSAKCGAWLFPALGEWSNSPASVVLSFISLSGPCGSKGASRPPWEAVEQQATGEGRAQPAWLPVQEPGQREGVTALHVHLPCQASPLLHCPRKGPRRVYWKGLMSSAPHASLLQWVQRGAWTTQGCHWDVHLVRTTLRDGSFLLSSWNCYLSHPFSLALGSWGWSCVHSIGLWQELG